jgi:hypothetical protein
MSMRGELPVRAGEVAALATSARRVMTAGGGTLGQPMETHRAANQKEPPMQALRRFILRRKALVVIPWLVIVVIAVLDVVALDEAVEARGRTSARRAGR